LTALSEREREVLVLLAQGVSNREIAEKLVITEGTVKAHVSNILGKLQAENRTQAANIAHRYGLV
jgi:RNA polymerase sigma factor (sigma-70 family)